MGLETATYVTDFVSSNPPSTDLRSQGDDHLRLIKAVLQSTFPSASKPFYFPKSELSSSGMTLDATDQNNNILVNTASGNIAVTLPSALTASDIGWTCYIFKSSTDANLVNVSPSSGTIATKNGAAATVAIGNPYEPACFVWLGTSWLAYKPTEILTGGITTAMLAAAAVTYAKMQNVSASRLLGNPTGSGASPSEISLDTTLAFSGTALKVVPSTGLTAALAVDFASQSDQQTGTATAKTVASAHQQDHDSACKAWVEFSGRTSNGACTIKASYNVSGITRSSQGVYSVSFTTPFASANYACFVSTQGHVSGSTDDMSSTVDPTKSANSAGMRCVLQGVGAQDPTSGYMMCFGRQ